MFLSYKTLEDSSFAQKATVSLLGNFGVIYSVKKLEGRSVHALSPVTMFV
jgi:hypothetical protein